MKGITTILLIASFSCYADKYSEDTVIEETNNYYYNDSNYINESPSLDKAIALSLAASHPFDYAPNKWQASVNTGSYNSEKALSFGIAKNFEEIDALFFSTYGSNSGKHAVTFGVMWRF